jgi:hypothetical protein
LPRPACRLHLRVRHRARTALNRSLLTGNAFQPLTHHAGPTVVGHDPWTDLPRRFVAHVLSVAALEIGDPLTFDVLVKTDDPPLHLFIRLRWSCECA